MATSAANALAALQSGQEPCKRQGPRSQLAAATASRVVICKRTSISPPLGRRLVSDIMDAKFNELTRRTAPEYSDLSYLIDQLESCLGSRAMQWMLNL